MAGNKSRSSIIKNWNNDGDKYDNKYDERRSGSVQWCADKPRSVLVDIRVVGMNFSSDEAK